MNQIIFSEHKNILNTKKKKKKIFKFMLFLSISSILCIFFYTSYFSYITKQKEIISKKLLNTFNLERLYSNNNYTTIPLNQNGNFFVIGAIEIPNISINYPILSEANDELLKIAPCRFYGPYPNEVGNLCIAGHNYDDSSFFSNLYELDIGDEINIYDSYNFLTKYCIYNKYEIDKNDTSCTSQDTNGFKEITLITCNNFNGNRLIIKGRENLK